MTEKEWKKLISQFDKFIEGWDKAYKKSNHKKSGQKNTLKDFEKSLKRDLDLTAEEKFELYYDEYLNRKKEKVHTIKSMLKDLGIDRSSDNK